TGSKEQDLLRQLLADRSTPVHEKLKANPSSLAALYYLYRYQSFRLSPEELRSNLELIDPVFSNTSYVAVLNELANTLEGVSVGNKAPGFVAYTQDGDTVGLNDYL